MLIVSSDDIKRPNFLIIQTDDQGSWAMPQRNADLVAPNIQRLVENGIDFENFYCASPVCSPSRASLLTGRMPSAHGVHDWIRGEAYEIPDTDSYLEGLDTTPAILAAAGWECGHSGKWHLGDSSTPLEGFTSWYAHRTGDGPYFGAPVWQNGQKIFEPRYITDAITEEAVNFIDANAETNTPFYLEVNYTAPHSPWVDQHPEKYTAIYRDCDFGSIPREEAHAWFSWEPGPVSDAMRDPSQSLIGYFASLSAVDDGVGMLLESLNTKGMLENTCVVYTSDNGFSCGHHGIWGKGNATWPLNVWQDSVRVPFIMSMPGLISPNTIDDGLASACDLHPTILDIAGITAPLDRLASGQSLLPRLTGSETTPPEWILTFDEYGGTRMVRCREWKYVLRANDGPEELYNLDVDPGESQNCAGNIALKSVQQDLRALLEAWFIEHSEPTMDAFNRSVSGRGQKRPVWRSESDDETYHSGADEIRRNKSR